MNRIETSENYKLDTPFRLDIRGSRANYPDGLVGISICIHRCNLIYRYGGAR
jgi:hypothetical protein